MRRIGLVACLALLLAGTARAGTLTLEFDLASSTLSVTSQSPLHFNVGILAGRMTLRVPSPDGAGISAGPAKLESFYLTATLSAFTRISNVDITAIGSIFSSLVGSVNGTVTPRRTRVVLPNPGELLYGIFLDCFPRYVCNYYGNYFPAQTGGTLAFDSFGSLFLQSPSVPGNAAVRGPLVSIPTGTLLITVRAIGNEVSRTFRAPEPALPWLRAAAILAVLALALRRAPQPVR